MRNVPNSPLSVGSILTRDIVYTGWKPAPQLMLRLLSDIDDHARNDGSAVAVRSVGRESQVEISRRQLLDQIFAIGQVVRDLVADGRPFPADVAALSHADSLEVNVVCRRRGSL